MSDFQPFDNTGAVEFAIKRIDELHNKISQLQQEAQVYRNEVDRRLLEETTPLQNEIDALTEQVKLFAQRHYEATGDRSIKLLVSGKRIGFRKGSITFYFADIKANKDNPALLQYCLDNNLTDFVKTEINETVDWASLKTSLRFTNNGKVVNCYGEIIENMRVEQAEDVFFITD